MDSFFEKVVSEILGIHNLSDLERMCFVVPSRRSAYFLKKALSKHADLPIISPFIFSIDDFITEHTDLLIADNIQLIFELYTCYLEEEPETEFNNFLNWAPTVLKDFDLIDQYMVGDTDLLFAFMSEADAIKRWQPEVESEIIISENVQNHFDFHRKTGRVYELFKKKLALKGIAYKGMCYKLMAENLETFLNTSLSYKHYYFVGLNALSISESQIIEELVFRKKATCYWDYDSFFMDSNHQAGEILRQYQSKDKFGRWNTPENILVNDAKEIEFYSCSNDSMQSKVVYEILLQAPQNTLIVVPEESMVRKLLFSLPVKFQTYNVSMGLGLNNSKLFSFYQLIMEIYQKGYQLKGKEISYHFSFLKNLLSEPVVAQIFSKALDKKMSAAQISESLIADNKVYLDLDRILEVFHFHPLIELIFQKNIPSVDEICNILIKIHQLIYINHFDDLDPLEKEYWLLLKEVLFQLSDTVESKDYITITGLVLLLKEISKLQKVPFAGDPEAGLQLMSMLETRCLDFDHIIFLSFNEGIIPSSNRNNSLIPFDAALHFNLPVYKDQDDIMSYHFYRLMMRAKHVSILYRQNSSGLGGKAEKSRFALQLEHDLAIRNPKIVIRKSEVGFRKTESPNNKEIKIRKTDEIFDKIVQILCNRGLSNTSINTYLNCTLKFYFEQILQLESENEIAESIQADVFGIWIHKTLENIGKNWIKQNKTINCTTLSESMQILDSEIDKVKKELFADLDFNSGLNKIYYLMAKELLSKYFKTRIENSDTGFNLVGLEERLEAIHSIKVQNSIYDIKIKGFIDSIEYNENGLSLIDYKTGKALASDLTFSKLSLQDAILLPKMDKLRQLVFYSYLATEKLIVELKLPHNTPVNARIYAFRNLEENLALAKFSKEEIKQSVENLLNEISLGLLDKLESFNQTSDKKVCQNCSYNIICNRLD